MPYNANDSSCSILYGCIYISHANTSLVWFNLRVKISFTLFLLIVHWYVVFTRVNPFTWREFTKIQGISNVYIYLFNFEYRLELRAPEITELITTYLIKICNGKICDIVLIIVLKNGLKTINPFNE